MALSIIIPLSAHEAAWKGLVETLVHLPYRTEIILALSHDAPDPDLGVYRQAGTSLRFVKGGKGRAAQMNFAARQALHAHIWFLHADTRLSPSVLPLLLMMIRKYPDDLLYMYLFFYDRKNMPMRINEWGIWWRSRIFLLPFGDQGFCIARKVFFSIGEYQENVPYGEDHLLVWQARRKKVRIRPVKAIIGTSARKYAQDGWLQTTLLHLSATFKQAAQQLWKECTRS